MLETLNEVPWHELTHAYGSAEDVPDLLKGLASAEKSVCSEALTELFGNIYHQGTIYQATGYAIPYLVELLISEGVEDKGEILGLLVSIASGVYREKPEVDAKEEIVKSYAIFIPFIDSQNEDERIFATILLSIVHEFRDRSHPLLWQSFKEEDKLEMKTHLLIGAVLSGDGKVSSHDLMLILDTIRYPAMQLSIAALLLDRNSKFNHPILFPLLIESYAETNKTFDDITVLWSIGDVILSVYDALFLADYSVLNQYYPQLLTIEPKIRLKTDLGKRMYAYTEYLSLLVKATFQDQLLLDHLTLEQTEVVSKASAFYTPTGDSMYDWWLENEFKNFYNTLKEKLEITKNLGDFRQELIHFGLNNQPEIRPVGILNSIREWFRFN